MITLLMTALMMFVVAVNAGCTGSKHCDNFIVGDAAVFDSDTRSPRGHTTNKARDVSFSDARNDPDIEAQYEALQRGEESEMPSVEELELQTEYETPSLRSSILTLNLQSILINYQTENANCFVTPLLQNQEARCRRNLLQVKRSLMELIRVAQSVAELSKLKEIMLTERESMILQYGLKIRQGTDSQVFRKYMFLLKHLPEDHVWKMAIVKIKANRVASLQRSQAVLTGTRRQRRQTI